jgi:hypothetical protein
MSWEKGDKRDQYVGHQGSVFVRWVGRVEEIQELNPLWVSNATVHTMEGKAESEMALPFCCLHYDRTMISIILNRFNAFRACGWPAGMKIMSPSFR